MSVVKGRSTLPPTEVPDDGPSVMKRTVAVVAILIVAAALFLLGVELGRFLS